MTDQKIKELYSRKILQMEDKAKENVLRSILFSTKNKIDWQEAHTVALTNMPELIKEV